MRTELTNAQWLHEQAEISIEDLAHVSGMPAGILRELVEYGALTPVNAADTQWRFTVECVVAVRTVSRLREDFELDANALSVALNLVERIHKLEAELRSVRSQIPGTRIKR
ncbi:MAG: chaperone modulator CbpM [Betaproteobacteria bacterium]